MSSQQANNKEQTMKYLHDKIAILEAQVDNLKREVDGSRSEAATNSNLLNERVADLTTRTTNLGCTVARLQGLVDNHHDRISQLETRVGELEAEAHNHD